jgi:hypothetical protein
MDFEYCTTLQNELAILEFIHCLVETLDRFFSNVCELDLMFNMEMVRCSSADFRSCPAFEAFLFASVTSDCNSGLRSSNPVRVLHKLQTILKADVSCPFSRKQHMECSSGDRHITFWMKC